MPTEPEETADTPRIETPRLTFRPLGPGDEAVLQAALAAAGDYFPALTGRMGPDPEAAAREIRTAAATPGRDVALLVPRGGGDPVGMAAWWRGHPDPDVTLLGMLLVARGHRGEGVAREALDALEGWLRERGIRRLRTAAPTRDRRSAPVLRALGFELMPVRDQAALGLGGLDLTLWEKELA